MTTLADRIDALLPQTQCEQCGYHGCRPYAEAIAKGDADINQCPPGGSLGIAKLAALLDRALIPLNPENGVEKPRALARIIEADCIGCTKCIQVCPVDAIVGANKLMHTVLEPMPLAQADDQAHMDVARVHFQRREARLIEQHAAREAELASRKADVHTAATKQSVLDALARVKAKKQEPKA
jgi:electron transport complex protein RnfB